MIGTKSSTILPSQSDLDVELPLTFLVVETKQSVQISYRLTYNCPPHTIPDCQYCFFRDLFGHHWLSSRRRGFDRAGDHTHASARDRHTRPSHLGPAAALLNIHKRVIVDAAAYASSVYYAFLIGFSLVSASSPRECLCIL